MPPPLPAEHHLRAYEVSDIAAPGDGRFDVVLGDPSGRGTVHARLVRPSTGAAWTAGFVVDDGGEPGLSVTSGTPSPNHACVLVDGAAFLVAVLGPAATLHVRTDGPVREVAELADEGLLLLATAWTITAVGEGVVRWTTPRLSVESLRLDAVVDHRLHGVADPADEPRTFVVDLRTGTVEGGPT